MTAVTPVSRPMGAAVLSRAGTALMEIILHLGAHRTGTTTFQHYMRDHLAQLGAEKTGFWGPRRTRQSVFPGFFAKGGSAQARQRQRRAEGRIALHRSQAAGRGLDQLVISDENMIGTPRGCLIAGQLYPAIGMRMARFAAAFGGGFARVVLSVRSPDLWWASAAAMTVARGHPVPGPARFAAIAASARGWREVITDLACALPGTEIRVLPFERFAGRPAAVLGAALRRPVPADQQQLWLNRSPDLPSLRAALTAQGSDPALLPPGAGRWQPFTQEQTALLAERYADDLHWLYAGADGLAQLTEDESAQEAAQRPPRGTKTEGQDNDIAKGQLA